MFRTIIETVRKHFSIKPFFWKQVYLDLLFILCLFGMMSIFFYAIRLVDVNTLLAAKESILEQKGAAFFAQQLKYITLFFIMLLFFLAAILFLLRTVVEYFLYTMITKTERSFKLFFRFFFFAFLWTLLYIFLSALAFASIYPVFFFTLATAFFLLLSPFLFFSFFYHQKTFKGLARGFSFCIKNIQYILFAYLPIFAIFLILNILAGFLTFLPFRIGSVISVLLLFAIFAWARLFLYDVWKVLSKR